MLFVVTFALLVSFAWASPVALPPVELPQSDQIDPGFNRPDPRLRTHVISLEVPPELTNIKKDDPLEKSISPIIDKIGQLETRIKGWETLKLDHCKPLQADGQLQCEAIINKALLKGKDGKKVELSIKFKITGEIKNDQIDKLQLSNAKVKVPDVSSHKIASISWWTDFRDSVEDAVPAVIVSSVVG